MITREQYLDALITECNICKHLFTKISAEGFDYRPTPGQRSTLELLQYISMCGIAGMRTVIDCNWEAFKEYERRAETMTAEEFPAAMDRQIEEITATFNALTDQELQTVRERPPLGQPITLGYALLKIALGWMTAYRMQLFLYAKAAGAHAIGTANCWAGFDWEGPSTKAVEEEEAAA